jgi:hypothetical protein
MSLMFLLRERSQLPPVLQIVKTYLRTIKNKNTVLFINCYVLAYMCKTQRILAPLIHIDKTVEHQSLNTPEVLFPSI